MIFPDRLGGLVFSSNGNLIKQSNGLEFLYDHMGVFAVKYNDATYFYRKNAQNDIIALLDSNGSVVVKYKYDAWGNCKIINADGYMITDDTHIGILNPFRYRSYYFDEEIELYYLQSRYYDASVGRFINSDAAEFLVNEENSPILNGFSYCVNYVKALKKTGATPLFFVSVNGKKG